MIVPTKHTSFSESLLGFGAILLTIVKEPLTVDEIWYEFSEYNKGNFRFPAYHSFDNLILTINYLFLIGAVNLDEKGKIYHENSRA